MSGFYDDVGNVKKEDNEKNVEVTTTPIKISNGVQVNYELDEMKMNLFSIFGNSGGDVKIEEILTNLFLFFQSDTIEIPKEYILVISFEDGTIKFNFPLHSSYTNLGIVDELIKNKYKEMIDNNLVKIDNFYHLFQSYLISHVCNVIANSNIYNFLQSLSRQIQCEISFINRLSRKQQIHTDKSIFVSLTYEEPSLTPEIILTRQFEDETNTIISLLKNHKMYESIVDQENKFYHPPVLRFDIGSFTYPTVSFLDFVIFHASPHTNDEIKDGHITNMKSISKQMSLKQCRGRECQTIVPEVRPFIAVIFDLPKVEYDMIREDEINITAEQLARFVKQDIDVLTLTPNTFVHEINQILETGRLPGNITARGGKKQQRKNTNYYKKKSKKIIKKKKSNKSNKSKKYKKSIKK